MSATPTPSSKKPSTAEIICAYGLNREEAEVVSCLLKGKDKLQNYWRARSVLERLCQAADPNNAKVVV